MYIMITGLAKADWGICDEENAEERKEVGDNMPKSNKLVLFPNPAKYLLLLDYTGSAQPFRIVSMLGATVIQGTLQSGITRVGTQSLQPGIYYLVVEGQERPVKFSIVR